jgi:hypothetical protein
MKMLFKPTTYRVDSSHITDNPTNSLNGVDNDSPAVVHNGSWFELGTFQIERQHGMVGDIASYFGNRKKEYYITNVTLRVKVGFDAETKPESLPTWKFTPKYCKPGNFPESGVAVQELEFGPDMITDSETIADAWFYKWVNDDDIGKIVVTFGGLDGIDNTYIYGAEIEVEYEKCAPIVAGNFVATTLDMSSYYPGTERRRTQLDKYSKLSNGELARDVITCPKGGQIYADFTSKPSVLYVNGVSFDTSKYTVYSNYYRYKIDITGPTTILGLPNSTLTGLLMGKVYRKVNGRWQMEDDPENFISYEDSKYHKG